MNWLMDLVFKKRLEQQTDHYINTIKVAPALRVRRKATNFIQELLSVHSAAKATLGLTPWGQPVSVPLKELMTGYGLVTGSTGSGKTRFALLIIKAFLDRMPDLDGSFGILDPKGDLYFETLYLLKCRLAHLKKTDPLSYERLLGKILIYDFGSRDPVSAYNILAPWPGVDPDFFAANRADLLLDLLEGPDSISLTATSVLEKLILLLSEFKLPITQVGDVLHDNTYRRDLLRRSHNQRVKNYFSRQFAEVRRSTIEAIDRRIEALFSSESIKLAVSGTSAPDFRRFQDEGKIVLVNCFGPTIARSARRLLQRLVLSDIRQSVFARRKKAKPFLWITDEAQNFFTSRKVRENMSDLLTMSRSFGSFFLFLTQNMSTAVQDRRMLNILYTNIRWSFSMRGEPGDCEFLKSALPVTGRKPKPKADPFSEQSFYSLNDERNLVLANIANLPDRSGYLWFKARTDEAFPIRTADLHLPGHNRLFQEIHPLRSNPNIGRRISRKVYEQLIREREERPEETLQRNLTENLEQAYRRRRG